jgi:hypothetical protein
MSLLLADFVAKVFLEAAARASAGNGSCHRAKAAAFH